jgi:hypothetical protein
LREGERLGLASKTTFLDDAAAGYQNDSRCMISQSRMSGRDVVAAMRVNVPSGNVGQALLIIVQLPFHLLTQKERGAEFEKRRA